MNHRAATRSLVSLIALLPTLGCSPAYSESFRKEAAKQTLVSLEVQSQQEPSEAGPPETGTAILVGSDAQQFYLLTAKHVLPEDKQKVRVKSIRWGDREISAVVTPITLADDLALFTLRRDSLGRAYQNDEPFWNVAPDGDSGIQAGFRVHVLARQHGLKLPDPAEMQVSSEKDSSLDRFTMTTTTPPVGGDSGGGVFNDRWQLVGLYTGQANVFDAYRMDRALQLVENSEFTAGYKVRLKPAPRAPSQTATWIGVGLLGLSMAFAAAAYQQRHAYYDDVQHGDSLVKPFNVAADGFGAAGIGVLGVQLGFTIYYHCVVEPDARKGWQ